MAFAADGALVAFTTLQIFGGQAGMLLILSTIFLSNTIVRHPVFVNFCITWVIYALSYTLLFYAGQIFNPFPNFSLCLIQSAMIYAAPVMGSVTVFVFTLHLFLVLRQTLNTLPLRWPRLRLTLMLAAPYVAYITMFSIAIFIGYSEAHKIHRSHFYCTMKINRVTMLAGSISAVAILASLAIEILTVYTVHRNWIMFRRQKTGVSISILVRTFIVLVSSIIVFCTSLAFLASLDSASTVPNFVIACVPVSVFLVFGTQRDFLESWFFCCMSRKGRGGSSLRSPSVVTASSSSVFLKEPV